jgi:hypothetical protein
MDWLRSLSQKVLSITHGRTTAFFISFFVAGHAMAYLGKLTPVYVGFMGTLGGLVLGHSIKEGVEERLNPARPLSGPDVPAGGDRDH